MSGLPKEWFRLASEDFKTAQILFKESIWSHVCFHAQQAVEKGLKSLIESRKEVPKIHDLLELTTEAEKCGFDVKNSTTILVTSTSFIPRLVTPSLPLSCLTVFLDVKKRSRPSRE